MLYKHSEHWKDIREKILGLDSFKITPHGKFYIVEKAFHMKVEISPSEKNDLDTTNFIVIKNKDSEEWIARVNEDDEFHEENLFYICCNNFKYLSKADQEMVLKQIEDKDEMYRVVNNEIKEFCFN